MTCKTCQIGKLKPVKRRTVFDYCLKFNPYDDSAKAAIKSIRKHLANNYIMYVYGRGKGKYTVPNRVNLKDATSVVVYIGRRDEQGRIGYPNRTWIKTVPPSDRVLAICEREKIFNGEAYTDDNNADSI